MGAAYANRQDLEALQQERLGEALELILGANRFYQAKTRGIGRLDTGNFKTVCPFTLKSELAADQAATPPFGTNLTFPISAYTRYHQTSGTHGPPLRWLDTNESWQTLIECWSNVLNKAGVTQNDRVFFAFSFGPFLGFWLAFEAAAAMRALCIPGGGLSSASRLKTILDTGATVLCCTPTYAFRLADEAKAARMDLGECAVRKILVAGEAGGSLAPTRELLSRHWAGAQVYDHHGMTETGPVTYQCPLRPGRLHVMEHSYLPEIIDEQGLPCPPGEPGELILTTLRRTAMPLLRYRTGDRVRSAIHPGNICECGSPEMGLDGGILARIDDMIIVRGVNVYPGAVESAVRKFNEIKEYQAVVSSKGGLKQLHLRIETTRSSPEAEALALDLERELQTTLSLRIPVQIAGVGTLPKFEMKARRWVVE